MRLAFAASALSAAAFLAATPGTVVVAFGGFGPTAGTAPPSTVKARSLFGVPDYDAVSNVRRVVGGRSSKGGRRRFDFGLSVAEEGGADVEAVNGDADATPAVDEAEEEEEEDTVDIVVDEENVVIHPANIEHAAKDDAVDGEDAAEESKEPEPLVLEPVPPASFSVETSPTGPGGSPVTTLTVHLGAPGHPDPLVLQTGKIGRQAAGSVTLSRGDTVLYATAARDDDPKENIDFLPLSVDYQERFSSAGLTSGSYNRRDGRPAEHEVLTCRLIDRPLRPLVADGWRHETQLLSWVLSYDGVRSCDPLAIVASAAALWISDVPLAKPVAAAQVGYVDGQFVLNPTNDQMDMSSLHLTVAGTKDAVLMIEGAADFLPEATMVEAVKFGHGAIKVICDGLEELGKVAGKPKIYGTLATPPEGLQEAVDALALEKVDAMYADGGGDKDKDAAGAEMKELQKWVVETLEEERFPERASAIKSAFKDLLCRRMYRLGKDEGRRCDGRLLEEVRRIDVEAGILPRVHGSALFTRGETQAVATATLGDSGMRQKIDKIDGLTSKRFYLQYTFPPSCVGETGRVGAPGRREIGHGNLAERALLPTLPSEEDFPYTVRVESLVTESHGSSSMASVCGGCLALMDAGVPVKRPVAGIAMGMLLDDKGGVSSDVDAVILSDILGTEDALGTMDFKVAGDREGITTFQLDIKCEGLTVETMERALEQARRGRLHILDKMDEVLSEPRPELPPTVPKMGQFAVPEEAIGRVIGPGGRQIRAVIEDFELTNMDVEEDGTIQITAMNATKLEMAREFVMELVSSDAGGGKGGPGGGKRGGGPQSARAQYIGPDPVEGEIYRGKITGIHDFGVFVEILPGAEDGSTPGLEGLCHVSELHVERVRNCPGFVASLNTEEIEVKYLGKNDRGKLQLSRRAVLEDRMGTKGGGNGRKRGGGGGGRGQGGRGGGGGRGGNGGGGDSSTSKKKDPPLENKMSQDEIEVIAKAIEGITDL